MTPDQMKAATKFLAAIEDPTDPKVDAKKLAEISRNLQKWHERLRGSAKSAGVMARWSVELNVPCQKAVEARKLSAVRKAAEG